MIIDILENASLYEEMYPLLRKAFDFLKSGDYKELAPGKYEIEGSDVYAMVQQYETRPLEDGVWEAYRKYIDIQFVYDGIELMGYSNIEGMKVTKEYDESEDYLLLDGEGSFFKIKPGFFAVLFPEDVHMPSITDDISNKMKKVVVKVKVD